MLGGDEREQAYRGARQSVGGVVVAAVNGGDGDAGGDQQEHKTGARSVAADRQRRSGGRGDVPAGEKACAHGVTIEKPGVESAESRGAVRTRKIVKQFARRRTK